MSTLLFKVPGDGCSVISSISSSGGRTSIGTIGQSSVSNLYVIGSPGSSTISAPHNFPIAAVAIADSHSSTTITVSDNIRVFQGDKLISVLNPHGDACNDICPFTGVSVLVPSETETLTSGSVFAVVSDVKGCVSVIDVTKGEIVQMIQLTSEILYSCAFVTENVIACVGESGNLFVTNRVSNETICSENEKDELPNCQPRLLAWLPDSTLLAVANQMSGSFSVYEMSTCGDTPRLVGSSNRISLTDELPENGANVGYSTGQAPGYISSMCWLVTNPLYLAIARDSAKVEVWAVFIDKRFNSCTLSPTPHFEFNLSDSIAEGVSAIESTIEGKLLVGTTQGRVLSVDLPADLSTDLIDRKFNDSPNNLMRKQSSVISTPQGSFPALDS